MMNLISLKTRRKTRTATIGAVKLGHQYPVAMQSMCSTKTENVDATVEQILELEGLDCDVIRVAVPTQEAAEALPSILERINIPLVADIHFDARLAFESMDRGAHKIRINPGNIVANFNPNERPTHTTRTRLELLEGIIQRAKEKDVCIRIGVNAGSLEQDLWDKYGAPTAEALVESGLRWLKFFDDRNFANTVISLKSSQVPVMIAANQMIAARCDVPLHLGVTEAGPAYEGSVKSAVGFGVLLHQGIGDTIRTSLSDHPREEMKACKEILKSLKLYTKEPDIVSCPTCGRIDIDLVPMVEAVKVAVAKEGIKKDLRISVMGCVVNALGEAKEADFAIAGGRKQGNLYFKGELYRGNIPEDELLEAFIQLIRDKKDEV
jgi:(E)-4-hydroxy-3-methylbut-2-enyl-diphosphate synthase